MDNKYTNSSLKNNKQASEAKTVKKVVKGPVKTKKKSEVSKIAKSIVSEECKNIKEYVIYDVVVPVIKDTFAQIIKGATDMIFFGEVRNTRSSGWGGVRGGSTKISYKDCWDNRGRSAQPARPTNRMSYDDLYFDNKDDAMNVLTSMDEIVDQYGVVTVADLFDLAGVTGNGYTDQNYGWTSTNSAEVVRGRDGNFYLKLQRPMPIK